VVAAVTIAVVVTVTVATVVWASSSAHAPTKPGVTPAALARNVFKVQAATVAVTAAGTAASSGFADLPGLPTVPTVAAVTDPYLTALQTYEGIVAGTQLPVAVTGVARSVATQLGNVTSFLHTLGGIASSSLGGWITTYYLDTAELEAAITHLQNLLPNVTP
jgi:hypothetical protein